MSLTVAFLDVCHGDCAVATFVQDGRKGCIVVDGGEDKNAARRLATYLTSEDVEVIDLLVATHIDSDHINGLVHFLGEETAKTNGWNNGQGKCITHYWGPEVDPGYSLSSPRQSSSLRGRSLTESPMRNFVIQSVDQNQKLSKLVERHIVDVGNIRHPSLEDRPPSDILEGVSLDIMAPDKQIPDTDVMAMALSVTNTAGSGKKDTRHQAHGGKRMTLQDLKMTVAANAEAAAEIADRTANNQSIVLKLTPRPSTEGRSNDWSFLFTGDADQESWMMMRETPSTRAIMPSRVLKVPHHGSVNGIDGASLEAIRPAYCIISVGQKHGLPDGSTLNLIRSASQAEIFCTQKNRNKAKPGPCSQIVGCPRARPSDSRGIRFTIDAGCEEAKIETFTMEVERGTIHIESGDTWCPGRRWPDR